MSPRSEFDKRAGENLKRLRVDAGLSQSALAELMTALGHPLQQQTVLKIESGDRPLRWKEVDALAQILDASLLEFRDDEGLPTRIVARHLCRAAVDLGIALDGVRAAHLALANELRESMDTADEWVKQLGELSEDRIIQAVRSFVDDAEDELTDLVLGQVGLMGYPGTYGEEGR